MPAPQACKQMKQSPLHACLTSIPVGWNTLLDHVEQPLGTRPPVTLPRLRNGPLHIRDCPLLYLIRFLEVFFRLVDFNQSRPAVCCLVQRLCYRRGLGVVLRVVLVNLCLFCGTLRLALPVTAEFVVDEVKRREVSPSSAGELLDHLLKIVFIHSLA